MWKDEVSLDTRRPGTSRGTISRLETEDYRIKGGSVLAKESIR